MQKALFLMLILVFLFTPNIFGQETLTISTYYPSPYGSYNDLVVDNQLTVGTTSTPPTYAALEVNTTAKTAGGQDRAIHIMDTTYGGLLIGYEGATIQGRTKTTDANTQNLILQNWGGNVGIGIGTAPAGTTAKLEIKADGSTWGGWYEAIRFSSPSHAAITLPSGGLLFGLHSNRNFYWADTTNNWYAMTLTSDGTLSCRGTKSFEIDHPTKPGYKLVHACLEGPEAAVFYRGEAQLYSSKLTVVLPEYFEALTRTENRTVQLTPIGGYSPLYVKAQVTNGRFTVETTAEGNPKQKFYWEVKAIRKDIEPLKVEKLITKETDPEAHPNNK